MSREIKFRAWNEKEKKMFAVRAVDFKEKLVIDENGESHKYNFTPLMQFTGLKDKNGKEIWEGDILAVRELHDGDEHCWDNSEQKAIPQPVSWDTNRLCFDFAGCSRVKYSPNHFEVIGNVYEHPDLLTHPHA